jgi:hypothetical protein
MSDIVEHVSGRFKASRHKFVIPGLVDGDVVAEQSRKQIALHPEETIIVHHHRQEEECAVQPHDAYGTSIASAKVKPFKA